MSSNYSYTESGSSSRLSILIDDLRLAIFSQLINVTVGKRAKIFAMKVERFLVIFANLMAILSIICAQTNDNNLCELKFCLQDPDYPEQVLSSLGLWKFNFIPREVERSLSPDSFLAETKLCESTVSFLRPQKLKNSKNILRTIVNHLNYTQVIRFETCISENFPCTFNVFPENTKSFCHQNYSPYTMLALDEEQGCIVSEEFLIPMSCDCMIEKTDLLRGVTKDLFRKHNNN